jgi:glutathione S-transferase
VARESFTTADCAAACALFYAQKVMPSGGRRHLTDYFARLSNHPSFARVLDEAKPYFAMFPG